MVEIVVVDLWLGAEMVASQEAIISAMVLSHDGSKQLAFVPTCMPGAIAIVIAPGCVRMICE